jgi:hypothetical protein
LAGRYECFERACLVSEVRDFVCIEIKKALIIVRLKGGQGNQMFEYAIARALAVRNHDKVQLDLTFLLDRTPGLTSIFGYVVRDYDIDVFKLHDERFTALSRVALRFPVPILWGGLSQVITLLKSWLGRQALLREMPNIAPAEMLNSAPVSGDIYLDGYWQSGDYFESIAPEIRHEFALRNALSSEAETLAREISAGESVCVNVRRGDFVSLERSVKRHGFIGKEYYERGMELIKEKVGAEVSKKIHIYIFSDEIDWCRENIKFPGTPTTYVGYEYKGQKFEVYLRLMSLCKYFLIPNSTFGWWAAWLSDYRGKVVVAPRQWYANAEKDNIVPQSWSRI